MVIYSKQSKIVNLGCAKTSRIWGVQTLLLLILLVGRLFAAESLSVGGGPTVVIDAGHGGKETGARGHNPYCEEKRLSLLTARLVKKYLLQLGYRVIMTRSADDTISLERRVDTANKAGSDFFVSVHFNWARTPNAQGIEIFFCEKDNARRAAASRKAAQLVLSRVLRRTLAASRGVKKGNFYVIRETSMPAILVEGGFISNSQERALLKDPEYLEKLARGIADGVDAYFKKA